MYNIGRSRFDLLYVVLYYYRHVSLRVIRYVRDIRGVLTLCIHAIERVRDARRFRGIEMCIDRLGASRPKDYIHTSANIRGSSINT